MVRSLQSFVAMAKKHSRDLRTGAAGPDKEGEEKVKSGQADKSNHSSCNASLAANVPVMDRSSA